MEEKIRRLFSKWLEWEKDEKGLETARHWELHVLIRDELVLETQEFLQEILNKH